MVSGDPQPAVGLGVNPNANQRSSAGSSDLDKRFEVLERRIADVSNDLAVFKTDVSSDMDVFKELILNSFESIKNNLEEFRKEMKGQRAQNEEVILLCTCVYFCVLTVIICKYILLYICNDVNVCVLTVIICKHVLLFIYSMDVRI